MVKPFLLTILLGLCLIACTSTKQNSSADESKALHGTYRIAVIPKGTTHSYWLSVHAGAEKAAQELGVELVWQGPKKEDDKQGQIQTVQHFTSQLVNAIVLAPIDLHALAPSVASASRQHIPVIIIDSDLESQDFHSFIATDNKLAGKLCAKRLCELLEGKGKVAMLRYHEGSASAMAREDGFIEGLKEYGPSIELVSSNQYAGVTIEKSIHASLNLLNNCNQLDGIFTPTELTTQGMLQALEMRGKAGQVKFVGFDSNTILLEALKKDKLHGLAIQDPFKMGYEGVKTAIAILKNQPFEKHIDTGIILVTKENLNDPMVTELLNTNLNRWLKE